MKKWLCAGLCLLLLGLTACGTEEFRGSRVLRDDGFYLEYTVLDAAESAKLTLNEGDVIIVDVISEEGQISLSIVPPSGDPVYTGTDVETAAFTVTVSESGEYVFTVTGNSARGSVSFSVKSGS